MLWLASWDHYVHGDGEVQVFLPIAEDDGEHPPRIDVIYLKGLAWPDVLAPLGTSVSSATGRIPKKFLDSWESEGDCAGARIFEGEYRELLKVLAQAELRLDLIPLLKREADVSAVRTALALAATDVARASAGPQVKDELVTEILQVAAVEYAVPRSAPLARRYAESLGELVTSLTPIELAMVSGPRFVTRRKFDELAHSARQVGDSMQVSANLELVFPL